MRVVLGPASAPEGERPVAVDLAGGAVGRGAHVHAAPDCLDRACRAGFARSFRCRVRATAADLADQICAAADRRVAGILGGAARGRKLAMGADAAREALAAGAPAVVVARDAGGIATTREIAAVAAEGRAVVFGSKAWLGALWGREEVAVLAILDQGIADELRRVLSMADAVRGQRDGRLEV